MSTPKPHGTLYVSETSTEEHVGYPVSITISTVGGSHSGRTYVQQAAMRGVQSPHDEEAPVETNKGEQARVDGWNRAYRPGQRVRWAAWEMDTAGEAYIKNGEAVVDLKPDMGPNLTRALDVVEALP